MSSGGGSGSIGRLFRATTLGLTEGQGVPLVTHSTGANVPDVNELLPLVDNIPPVRRKADRPRRVPDNLYADRAYDSQPHRQELEARD